MADVTMTINDDKTISLTTQSLGSQGERVSIDVIVPAAVAALGYEAYIDFLLPDGSSCYKGGYDCSSEAFTFGLGEVDSIMDKDGEVQMQFWVGTIVASVKTVYWATAIKKTKVNESIGATSAAVLPYVPQMVYPSTFPADLITLEDAANRFTATKVEQGLAEIAGAGRTNETVKANAAAIIVVNTRSTGTFVAEADMTANVSSILKDSLGRVSVTLRYQKTLVFSDSAYTLVGTLPAGYRPAINFATKVFLSDNTTGDPVLGDAYIKTDGTVYIKPSTANCRWVHIKESFEAV